MRKSFHGKWLKNEDGSLLGIDLGADYCAEHEQGIAALNAILGLGEGSSSSCLGIEKRKISKLNPDQASFIDSKNKKNGFTSLVVGWMLKPATKKTDLPDEVKPYRGKKEVTELSCAWSEKDFAIYTESDDGRKNLRELNQALRVKNAALWVGGSGPFQNGGLCIIIVDRVSEENLKTLVKSDQDLIDLEIADESVQMQTQLKSKLKSSGKSYFALVPHWKKEHLTEYSIVYWLNPFDQGKSNFGYFTVEQLLEWSNNTGPVVKVKLET
jgi:hypothetical protein